MYYVNPRTQYPAKLVRVVEISRVELARRCCSSSKQVLKKGIRRAPFNLSKGLARNYLNWCRNKRHPKDVLSVLSLVDGAGGEDMHTISHHAALECTGGSSSSDGSKHSFSLGGRETIAAPGFLHGRIQGETGEANTTSILRPLRSCRHNTGTYCNI